MLLNIGIHGVIKLHYAIKDIIARCSAASNKEERECELSRLSETRRCLYRTFEDVCESPKASDMIYEEYQVE